MRRRISAEGWSVAAFVAGFVLRAWFVSHHARVGGDSLVYGDLAHNMLRHHAYGFTEVGAHGESVIRSTLIRLPGYPLFLAACFAVFGDANYAAAVWVQVALDLVTCGLLGVLATRLMGHRAGQAVLWAACLCPFTANYSASPLTETCSLFCVALAFFALERWLKSRLNLRWAAVIGGALVGAVLVRPEQALLGVAVVPLMGWVGRREWRAIGVCVGVIAVPMFLWTGRNLTTLHQFSPLAPKYANDAGEFVSYGFYRWYRTWGVYV